MHRINNTAQRIGSCLRSVIVAGKILLHFVLYAGKRELCTGAFDLEKVATLPCQCIQMPACRERQGKHDTGAVDQLTGGNIRGAANAGAFDIFPLRLNQQQLRSAAG